MLVIPNHKSYVDWMLLIYIFFTNKLPTAHIVAFQDMANITFLSRMARQSGTVFIRRQKGNYQEIYQAILSEYVHKLLADHNYLNFFIEKGRSSVGKIKKPNLDLFSTVCDAFYE